MNWAFKHDTWVQKWGWIVNYCSLYIMIMMQVNCCAFSPDCLLVLMGSDGGRLYLWRASNRKLVAKVRGHTGLDDQKHNFFFCLRYQKLTSTQSVIMCVIFLTLRTCKMLHFFQRWLFVRERVPRLYRASLELVTCPVRSHFDRFAWI